MFDSVYTKDENSCVVAKTKPQSVITTALQRTLVAVDWHNSWLVDL